MNHFRFHHQIQQQIKVEPEVSFYKYLQEGEGVGIGSKASVQPHTTLSSAMKGSRHTRPQTCKVCGKILSSPSSYYVHMKLHSGAKPFRCKFCDAAFCRKPYLEVHMRTHTGERPFQCSVCLKRFTQKSSLNTHKRVHTGERPYSCDVCNKSFAVKSYVTAHRWSHVSEKPLTCDRCSMTFTSRVQFASHVRLQHALQGPGHECQLCGRVFVRDSSLIRHQTKVHLLPPLGHFAALPTDIRSTIPSQ